MAFIKFSITIFGIVALSYTLLPDSGFSGSRVENGFVHAKKTIVIKIKRKF